MNAAGEVVASLARKFQVLFPHLDERQRRLVMGAEARALGHGGIRLVARAAGVREGTVSAGVTELESGADPLGRVRRPGGGRKSLTELDPGLVSALLELVEPDVRGDPVSPLRWTTRSTRDLAAELTGAGHPISAPKVGALLREQGFSLQGNAKVLEGAQHPDRDAQFQYINARAAEHHDAGQPVVSVDAKKKEIIGEFKNAGREWRPAGDPRPVDVHDFPDEDLGKALPYGIYDVAANTGWVNVGTDHDTAAFAVESIRRWCNAQGRLDYPQATRLLITADAGGSNGYRTRAWKTALAAFAAESRLSVTVCHFPPGTSKWNRIEHRLFSAITMNWRGRPLTSHEVVVNTIAATTTRTGLTVHAELDTDTYPTGIRIGDAEVNSVPVTGHAQHGEWNYTLHPQPTPTASPGPEPDHLHRAALTDPALTGISRTELDALATTLAAPHQQAREQASHERLGDRRRRAPGGGRPPKLALADQITAALLHHRLALPPAVLAKLFDVSTDTARHAISEAKQLLDQHGYTQPPPVAHLSTLAGLTFYAATCGIHPTVGWPGGLAPPGSHGTERDSLPSLRSSHRNPANVRTQRQWVNSSGSRSTTPNHHFLNRL
jgi:hypothetical protein